MDEDELVIDNKHQTQKNTSKALAIASIPDEDEEEPEEQIQAVVDYVVSALPGYLQRSLSVANGLSEAA